MKRSHILAEIRRLALANGGKPLGRVNFEKETGIRERDWLGKHWASWGDACEEAGFEPNKLNKAFSDEYLLEKLAGFVHELGSFPTSPQLNLKARSDADFPSRNTFSRFGRKAQVAAALLEFCNTRDDLDDVAAICTPLASRADPPDETPLGESELGSVYLMKSGRYYKIGRSNSVGRREYEIALQLPEKVEVIHVITTDDPVGIERYWHQRFADRRKNGEWFALTRADVAAFKRRKFM